MIQYLAAFGGGVAIGVGLLLAHQYSVKRAVRIEQTKAKREADKLHGHIERLQEDCRALELSAETARARAAGKIVGIQEGRNMSQAEKLVRELEGNGGQRTVQVGGAAK